MEIFYRPKSQACEDNVELQVYLGIMMVTIVRGFHFELFSIGNDDLAWL